MDFVLGLDVGTAGSRAVAVASDGRVLAAASSAHPSMVTGGGRIEQDPAEWWQSAASCLHSITSQAGPAPLAVGVSGQTDGPVLLGAERTVLGTCHIWADSRATAECGQITDRIGAERLIAVAGRPAVPAYTAPKLLWITQIVALWRSWSRRAGRLCPSRMTQMSKKITGVTCTSGSPHG